MTRDSRLETVYCREMSVLLTGAVGLVAVICDSTVLVTVAHELLHNAPPVVALEIPGVFAVRRCNHHITTPTSLQQ